MPMQQPIPPHMGPAPPRAVGALKSRKEEFGLQMWQRPPIYLALCPACSQLLEQQKPRVSIRNGCCCWRQPCLEGTLSFSRWGTRFTVKAWGNYDLRLPCRQLQVLA